MSPLAAEVQLEEYTQRYVRLEAKVGHGERLGLEARHEFGRQLLEERRAHGGKQLPHGRLGQIVEATGIGEREIRYRLEFAETFPEVGTAMQTFSTWDAFKNRNAGAHVGNNSGDNEWFTPPDYIAAALEVMGGIDLDPASTQDANEIVRASWFYTEVDKALEREWLGRVWMNPPYARPLIDGFCQKLAEEYSAGNVTQACVLTNNATETGWFHSLAEVAQAFCFPRGRVRFWHPSKESATPLQGQVVTYLGDNVTGFQSAFLRIGLTLVPELAA